MARGTIKPPFKTLLVRFSIPQYEWLREESFKTRVPMSEIVRKKVFKTAE